MNTTFIAMGVALFLAANLLIGMGALSLLTGAFHFLFMKPRLKVLKSVHGKQGFAFGFTWDHETDPVKFNQIKIHLFNPFGSPTQIEITRDFEPSDINFAVDLDLGNSFQSIFHAKGFENALIEIEMSSTSGGRTHQLSMKGQAFLEKINSATDSVEAFNQKYKTEKTKPVFVSAPDKSFIVAALPKNGKTLKLATNPEFAAQFAGAAGDSGSATSAVANYSVSKIWIEPGCIVCNACEGIFPEVFQVTDTTCIIRPGAPLNDGLKLQESAEACPVEVIKFTKI